MRFGRIFLFLTVVSFIGNAFAAPSADGANKFINKVGDTTIKIVSSNSNATQKEKELTKLFESSVDIDWIAKFVMGNYLKDATPEQSTEYHDLYQQFLLKSYVPKFRQYTNQKIVIIGTQTEGVDEFVVHTEIKAEGKPSVLVDYKVREQAGQYKIFDIVAEGVSLITTQRSEFGSILSRKGVAFLIEKLKDKIAQPVS